MLELTIVLEAKKSRDKKDKRVSQVQQNLSFFSFRVKCQNKKNRDHRMHLGAKNFCKRPKSPKILYGTYFMVTTE